MDVAGEMAAVALVLGLLGAALWLLKRRGLAGIGPLARHGSGGRRMECVERLSLGPQHGLHLIHLGGRALLVASSPSGCAVLADLEWRDADRPGEVRQ
jgi:flagellar biosynthetic protein FliO